MILLNGFYGNCRGICKPSNMNGSSK